MINESFDTPFQLEKTYNTRDLGGFPGKNEQTTAYRRFVRSDAPSTISDKDLAALIAYPVQTVIDLRGEGETESEPSRLARQPGVDYHNISIIDFSGNGWENSALQEAMGKSMGDFYIYMLEYKKENLARVFKTIAEAAPDSCTFFNCTHGKDRTGIVAAILLMLAGVSHADIIDSYKLSYDYLRPIIDPIISSLPAHMQHVLRSDEENMVLFLEYFTDKYNDNAAEYLLSIGLSPEEITALENRLFR